MGYYITTDSRSSKECMLIDILDDYDALNTTRYKLYSDLDTELYDMITCLKHSTFFYTAITRKQLCYHKMYAS